MVHWVKSVLPLVFYHHKEPYKFIFPYLPVVIAYQNLYHIYWDYSIIPLMPIYVSHQRSPQTSRSPLLFHTLIPIDFQPPPPTLFSFPIFLQLLRFFHGAFWNFSSIGNKISCVFNPFSEFFFHRLVLKQTWLSCEVSASLTFISSDGCFYLQLSHHWLCEYRTSCSLLMLPDHYSESLPTASQHWTHAIRLYP